MKDEMVSRQHGDLAHSDDDRETPGAAVIAILTITLLLWRGIFAVVWAL